MKTHTVDKNYKHTRNFNKNKSKKVWLKMYWYHFSSLNNKGNVWFKGMNFECNWFEFIWNESCEK